MSTTDVERLRSIKTFPSLVKYLRDELDWPIDSEDFDDLTFDYEAEELGLDSKAAVKIKEVKQLRPLAANQPWGVFFVNFEPKRLPVVVLRRILRWLVLKKRQSANKAHQAAWQLNDLLFISSYGDSDHRQITFANFSEEPELGDLPLLRVLGWDDQDTALHLDHADKELREKLRWPADPSHLEAWRSQWSSAFTIRHREVIATSKALAERLAGLAQRIRKRVNAILKIESEKGSVRRLHTAFKEALIHDLTEDDFADMYAQTIAYGLLTARVSRPAGLVADNLRDMVPVTNPFLKEMLETFLAVGGRKAKVDFDELGVSEVVQLLRDANMEAVLRDFGDRNPQEDPAIHFYELFLKEYDPEKRMKRGVFYTPRPVVSFIVRSVHEILQNEFGLEDGLADTTTWDQMVQRHKDLKIAKGTSPDEPFVQILDPACGTGTFLVEVIDIIHKTMLAKWQKQGHMALEMPTLWNVYVSKHLLPRLHGFELMMAPYAIAHMKIGLKLHETGYRFGSHERARIYLTNSLEPPSDDKEQRDFEAWAPALAHEAQAVNAIKAHQRFTVVIGNPPYSGHSANKGEWIENLIETYKQSPELRKPAQAKWLSDDYVKFIRFTQWRIEQARYGVFGLVTNHSYLDNPTFLDMRASLMSTFNDIYILDLHGNSKKKETTPDGGKDENVFDIQQGVAVGLMIRRRPDNTGTTNVHHAHLWGERARKYERLSENDVLSTKSTAVEPRPPRRFFIPQDGNLLTEYEKGWSVVAAMNVNGDPAPGIVTTHDEFAISWTREEAIRKVRQFLATQSEDEARLLWRLCSQSQWNYARAKQELSSGVWQHRVVQILYRPFDLRWTVYDRNVAVHRRERVMNHLLRPKFALITARSNKSPVPDHFFCASQPVETKCGESTTQSTTIPLLIYEKDGQSLFSKSASRPTPNFSKEFWADLTAMLGALKPTPEEVFAYIYAILYAPSYRTRYSDFLKRDFPRLPLTGNLELFRVLAGLGGELVALHLLESPKLDKALTTYAGPANSEVEKISYARDTVWLDKAQTRGFRGVPEVVWKFHVGGYQVCEKWLKDRKGRKLSKEDITHYHRIVVALHETTRLMKEIDEVIDQHGGWPLRGSVE